MTRFSLKKNFPEDQGPRFIYTNDLEKNYGFKYPNNYVRTSKYTLLTFIPKNLFEQFMRVANLYFLIISGLQQIPGVSPTGRWTTFGPLCVVIVFTAIKEVFEDLKRHRQDNEVNQRKVQVYRKNNWVTILWEEVQVGDIVKVENRNYVPADLILINTSETQGLCYIETANLDGETNLKSKQTLTETIGLDIDDIKGTLIKCEQPNNKLYNFDGSIEIKDKTYSVTVKQIVLRGAMLRNTKWIYGIAVFTGHDTKLMKNANPAPVKRTNVEKLVNYQILFMFCLLIIMAIISVIGFSLWQKSSGEGAWYLKQSTNQTVNTALSFITFVILYNNLIPISLYVSVEMVKFGQAYFINNDIEMYHKESDTPALARTSNLNEELGQVQYIFSDKTGTLTCNKMEFLKCTIAGISYGSGVTETDRVNKLRKKGNELNLLESVSTFKKSKNNFAFKDIEFYKNLIEHSTKEYMKEALLCLSLCHTVIPEEDKDDSNNVIYQCSSPDEAALVNAAKEFGYYFYKRTPKTVTVRIDGIDIEYEILNVLEFTNIRKRMSVIVREPNTNKLILYCKGADNVILERLSNDGQLFKEQTLEHLEEFAGQGLRTLCLSYVELTTDEYEQWNLLYHEASTTIINRELELEKVAEIIEKNLFLIGATAVEDKLQDGVPDTIATLAKADIKIWILTGDKQETAINIGFACSLLTKEIKLMILNESTKLATKSKIREYLKQYEYIAEESGTLALIIDGGTLHYALEDDLKIELLQLAIRCKAVICCRVSPLQKALVVRLVRSNLNAITLAIGDGANDVSMIQEAHVGIGISGEEGLQAARASDYTIAQFRFLKRLLLIHGRSSYRRISKVILYSFYKNVLLYFTQFWFTFVNGFSGQSLYERWTLATYNVAFTFFPILLYGLTDKDVQDETILNNPQLYISGQKKYHFNARVFWGWITNAIFHSFVIFIIPTLAFEHSVLRSSGYSTDLWSTGTVVYTCVILIANLKLAIETKSWTGPFQVALWISILVWILWLLIYGAIALVPFVSFGSDAFMVSYNVFSSAPAYFSIILVLVIAFYRDIAWKFMNRTYFPESYHVFQEQKYLDTLTHKKLGQRSSLLGSIQMSDFEKDANNKT